MLHKLKFISYSLIILFVLILPSQAVAQCLTKDECAAAADAQGLQQGGAGYDFAGPFRTKGCYSYDSGKYQGMAYFGTGGTESEMAAVPAPPKYRIPCAPSSPNMPPPVGENDPNQQQGIAVNSEVEGDAQCNTEDSCEAAAVAQGLTYVDAKPNRATMGCYTYSSGNYAGSVYFGKGGTDEENNAVLDPPKYRFCGPNKTDPTSAQYIAEEKEAACRSEAIQACITGNLWEVTNPGMDANWICKTTDHGKTGEPLPAGPKNKAGKLYRRAFDSCMASK